MLKLSFYLRLILVISYINYLYTASNINVNEGNDPEQKFVEAVLLQKTIWSYTMILFGFAECFLRHGVDDLANGFPAIDDLLSHSNRSIRFLTNKLSSSNKEFIENELVNPELQELFIKIEKILKECLNTKNPSKDLTQRIHDNLSLLQLSIMQKLCQCDISFIFPLSSKKVILKLIKQTIADTVFSAKKLLYKTPDDVQPQESKKKDTRKKRSGDTGQISEVDLQAASMNADLNAHLLMGCCTDGTCGSLEQKPKTKTKNKKGGGKKKKLKATGIGDDEPEQVQNEPEVLDLDPLITQSVEVLNEIVSQLKLISTLETQLVNFLANFQEINKNINEDPDILKDPNLQERVLKLPKNLIFENPDFKCYANLKKNYNNNLKKMTESIYETKAGTGSKDCIDFVKKEGYCIHTCKFRKTGDDIYSVD